MVGPLQKIPVDDVDPHLHGNPCEHRKGDTGRQRRCQQHHKHQHHGPRNAGQSCSAAGLNVHHRAHGGSRTRHRSKQTGHHIGQPLPDQFLVGVVFRAGQAVSHHGSQQRINAAEHPQHSGINHHQSQLIAGERRQLEGGKCSGKFRDRAQVSTAEQAERQRSARHQGE